MTRGLRARGVVCGSSARSGACLLYTSDAADELLCVDLGGRLIIKTKKTTHTKNNPTYESQRYYHSPD